MDGGRGRRDKVMGGRGGEETAVEGKGRGKTWRALWKETRGVGVSGFTILRAW
jgi:hypothetical protein